MAYYYYSPHDYSLLLTTLKLWIEFLKEHRTNIVGDFLALLHFPVCFPSLWSLSLTLNIHIILPHPLPSFIPHPLHPIIPSLLPHPLVLIPLFILSFPFPSKSQSLTNAFNAFSDSSFFRGVSSSGGDGQEEAKAETIRNLRKSFASLFSD